MKRYDKNFKEEAVRLVLEQWRKVPRVAQDIGVHENTLYKWIEAYNKHKEYAFVGNGNLRPDDEETRQFKKRIADLEEENAILKKAAAIFIKHQK